MEKKEKNRPRKEALARVSDAWVCWGGMKSPPGLEFPGFHGAQLQSVKGTFPSSIYKCKLHFAVKAIKRKKR